MHEYTYRWQHMTSNLRTPLEEEYLINAFIWMLGLVYQYMLLTQTHDNFVSIARPSRIWKG